jgi:hypothetical protein
MADKNQFQQALERLKLSASLKEAKEHCHYIDNKWDVGIDTVFKKLLKNPGLATGALKATNDEEFIHKWVDKYYNGYENRPSKKKGNIPGTKPDKLINTVINTRFNQLKNEEITNIMYTHRLSMTIENILGDILEEYLSIRLKEYKWYKAWGDTLNKIDFICQDGSELQVKNKSNTENSSSLTVRYGTRILKWARMNANKGTFFWDDLKELCNASNAKNISEKNYTKFVIKLIQNNPDLIQVDLDSPLSKDG